MLNVLNQRGRREKSRKMTVFQLKLNLKCAVSPQDLFGPSGTITAVEVYSALIVQDFAALFLFCFFAPGLCFSKIYLKWFRIQGCRLNVDVKLALTELRCEANNMTVAPIQTE